MSGPGDGEGSGRADAEEPARADAEEPARADAEEPARADAEDSNRTGAAGSPSADASQHVDPATLDDLDRVLECWLALIEHGRQYGIHIEPAPNRTVAQSTLAAAIADDLAFVARVDGRVVGFCSLAVETGGFERDVDRGVIENLYVEPAARGEGLGGALLSAGEERLIDRGVDVVAVETMVADESARSFYADRGYRPHRVTMERRVETDR